ncbi:hypothetical protein [Sporomusa sp.]|uniref:hypothetical protein n=1 Tax=Sporomusa sp. TaxID=2078658 RepID=UPI002CB4712F|nr:hypothetical protein [Sporomusa sp.]HWR42984.1 hypothetical protein [Sporomusa sp.]
MVDYTTRIIISLKDIEQVKKQAIGIEPSPESLRHYGKTLAAAAERAAAMMEVLAAAGFTFTAKKDYIYADSESVEAVAARRLLADHGFADREYQIYLEYRRQWGVL